MNICEPPPTHQPWNSGDSESKPTIIWLSRRIYSYTPLSEIFTHAASKSASALKMEASFDPYCYSEVEAKELIEEIYNELMNVKTVQSASNSNKQNTVNYVTARTRGNLPRSVSMKNSNPIMETVSRWTVLPKCRTARRNQTHNIYHARLKIKVRVISEEYRREHNRHGVHIQWSGARKRTKTRCA